ncbi:polycomb group protein Psc-like [Paramacrobiotus metropolitanus]|uniref:polycomb group protein Psc-like n=1 Tax=Paramacrobiotus metropolitanus TaxID=2943436 RepID=UPI002445F370|nr:polycomb group protein Psc-like [Paramacrobiotus metropolitanus]
MDNILRRSACDLNNLFKCGLCSGYLVDATALPECAHIFCKSCIVNHFTRHPEGPALCPRSDCGAEIHKTRPFSKIKNDRTLQTLLYKLFPEVYEDEMARRKVFWHRNSHEMSFFETMGKSATNEDMGTPELLHCLPHEVPGAALMKLVYDAAFGDFADLTAELKEKGDVAKKKPIFYHVATATYVSDVRLLISQTYRLDPSFVFLIHSQIILNPDLRISDIYRFYGQKAEKYLKIGFIFLDVMTYPDQISQEAAIIRIMRKKPWNPPVAVSRAKPAETEPSLPSPVESPVDQPAPVTASDRPPTDSAIAISADSPPNEPQVSSSPVRIKKKAEKLHGILSAKRNRCNKPKQVSTPTDEASLEEFPVAAIKTLAGPKTLGDDKSFAQLKQLLPEMPHVSVEAFYRINGTYEFFTKKMKRKKANPEGVIPLVSGKLKRKRSKKNVDVDMSSPIAYTLSLNSEFSADEQALLLSRLQILTGKNTADSILLLQRIRSAADSLDAGEIGGNGIQIDGTQTDSVILDRNRAGRAIRIEVKKPRKAKGEARPRKRKCKGQLQTGDNGLAAVFTNGDGDHTYAKNPDEECPTQNGSLDHLLNGSLELAVSTASMAQPVPFPSLQTSVAQLAQLVARTPSEAASLVPPFLFPENMTVSPAAHTEQFVPKIYDAVAGKYKSPVIPKERPLTNGRPRKMKSWGPSTPRLIKPKPASEPLRPEETSQRNGSSVSSNSRHSSSSSPGFPFIEQKSDCTFVQMPPEVLAQILSNTRNSSTVDIFRGDFIKVQK